MTTDKALKLSLEVLQINLTLLEKINPYKGQEDLLSDSLDLTRKAITAIKHARSAPVQEKWGASAVMNPDYVAAQKEKTQQALDVMAENARELGLNYEPDLQAELDATNRQVEILSDALAESRRQVDAMIALARADEREACAKVCSEWSDYTKGIAPTLAERIRARGNT